ncbi:MAG: GNAT family N-acetyltransferase [Micrococcus sp.]|nr:GNAT family N-acetyltransferase [Micrococcus sp.]
MTNPTPRPDSVLTVREARRDQLPQLAQLAGATFADMDLWRWLIPDSRRRPALTTATLRSSLADVHARDGRLLVAEVNGRVLGVAAWAAPGQAAPHRWRSLLAAPGMLRAGDRASLRLLGQRGPFMERAMRRVHPVVPHWYLGLLTVSPAAQTSGAGSALVHAGLELADRDRLPAYLECEPHLRSYYARFGFVPTERIDLGADGPDHYSMLRPAPR